MWENVNISIDWWPVCVHAIWTSIGDVCKFTMKHWRICRVTDRVHIAWCKQVLNNDNIHKLIPLIDFWPFILTFRYKNSFFIQLLSSSSCLFYNAEHLETLYQSSNDELTDMIKQNLVAMTTQEDKKEIVLIIDGLDQVGSKHKNSFLHVLVKDTCVWYFRH